MVMQNRISVSTYQNSIYRFNLIAGIVFSVALLVFFTGNILASSGSKRAAFIFGLPSSLAPIFSAVSTTLLFKVLGLPSMGAGSVIAAAASAVLMILPAFIMFMIFAFRKGLRKNSRFLILLIGILGLIIAFYPVVITVLALVVMPGNPSMTPLMQISTYMIHIRSLMIGVGLAAVYFLNPDRTK